MNDQENYQRAKKKVEAKLGFFTHLIVFIIVNAMLIIINLTTSPHELWFKWPLIGWGIGLFFHGLGVFVIGEGSRIKERMIEKEMHKKAQRENYK